MYNHVIMPITTYDVGFSLLVLPYPKAVTWCVYVLSGSSDVMVAGHPVSSPRAVPVHHRQSSQPSPMSSPSAITQSPPAVNPW